MKKVEEINLSTKSKTQIKISLPDSPDQLCDKITKEVSSVAVDWKSLRTAASCSCSTPFDQFSRKVRLGPSKQQPFVFSNIL